MLTPGRDDRRVSVSQAEWPPFAGGMNVKGKRAAFPG